MELLHKHHITPRHAGGTNDPSNLIEITIEEHAELHKQLWLMDRDPLDEIAYLTLSKQIGKEEATILAIRAGGIKRRGMKKTEDHVRKISEWHTQNSPTRGKPLSIEHRDKLSKKSIGIPKPESHRLAINVAKNLPESKKKHSQWVSNSVWVNDGKINSRVPNDKIPEGFMRGKIKKL